MFLCFLWDLLTSEYLRYPHRARLARTAGLLVIPIFSKSWTGGRAFSYLAFSVEPDPNLNSRDTDFEEGVILNLILHGL